MKQTISQGFLHYVGGILLLSAVTCNCSTPMKRQEEFVSGGIITSVVVSGKGDVYVAGKTSIFQFQKNSVSRDNLLVQYDVHTDISVFKLFEYMKVKYIMRCNSVNCFLHDSSNITQFWHTEPYDPDLWRGASLGGGHSSQAVFIPAGPSEVWIYLFSAISSAADGIGTFSKRMFGKNGNTCTMDYSSDKDIYINSKPDQNFQFIYSFYSDTGHVYFLRNTLMPSGDNVAFISRLCSNETPDDFRSYMESRIECKGYRNLLTATLLQSTAGTFTLLAAFSESSARYGAGSVLCEISLDNIGNYFVKGHRLCFKEARGSWPAWINQSGEACGVVSVSFPCNHLMSNNHYSAVFFK